MPPWSIDKARRHRQAPRWIAVADGKIVAEAEIDLAQVIGQDEGEAERLGHFATACPTGSGRSASVCRPCLPYVPAARARSRQGMPRGQRCRRRWFAERPAHVCNRVTTILERTTGPTARRPAALPTRRGGRRDWRGRTPAWRRRPARCGRGSPSCAGPRSRGA